MEALLPGKGGEDGSFSNQFIRIAKAYQGVSQKENQHHLKRCNSSKAFYIFGISAQVA